MLNDGLTGASGAKVGRTDETSHPAGPSRPAVGTSAIRGGDRVDISSLSQNVGAASAAQQAQQADRATKIAGLYRSGQYHVDSALVSRAMVSQALSITDETN